MDSRAHAEPSLMQAKAAGVPSARGRFLRIADVIATTGHSRSTIYRLIADSGFPRPIPVTKRTVGWWEADVVAWLEHRRQAA